MELKLPEWLKPKKKITFVLVIEGDYGIETAINDKIDLLQPQHKRQLKAFFEECIKRMK